MPSDCRSLWNVSWLQLHFSQKSKMHSFIWLPSKTNHIIFHSVACKTTFASLPFIQSWKRPKGNTRKRNISSLMQQAVVRRVLGQILGRKQSWIPSGTTRWGLLLSSRLLSRLHLTSNLWLCYIRINYRYFPPKWVTLTKTLSAGNLALFAD